LIEEANALHISTIVCDHHTPSDELPNSLAVLNPKRADCIYPFKELSGCGVAFKLCQALSKRLELPDENWKSLLDLCAVSIACDIVPIVGENRVLAHYGLEELRNHPRPAFKGLLANRSAEVKISDLVFGIGPQINAAGRMSHGKNAVEFMLSDNLNASGKGEMISGFNTERKELDKSITEEAIKQLDESKEAFSTVVYNEGWHKGVIGIVASRLLDYAYRPTIVLTQHDGLITGSARSISGVNIYNALKNCKEYLVNFGGHDFAAGLTLLPENLEHFKAAFESEVREMLGGVKPKRILKIDAEIDFGLIQDNRFFNVLKQFAPFGPKNSNPIFVTRGLKDSGYSKIVGATKEHLKISVTQDGSQNLNGIAVGMEHVYKRIEAGEAFDLAYSLEENIWNGNTTLQLMVKDIQFKEKLQQ